MGLWARTALFCEQAGEEKEQETPRCDRETELSNLGVNPITPFHRATAALWVQYSQTGTALSPAASRTAEAGPLLPTAASPHHCVSQQLVPTCHFTHQVSMEALTNLKQGSGVCRSPLLGRGPVLAQGHGLSPWGPRAASQPHATAAGSWLQIPAAQYKPVLLNAF